GAVSDAPVGAHDGAVLALLAGEAPQDGAIADVPGDADGQRALGRSLLLAPRLQALLAALRQAADQP
uniref:hypothetical protein n=1 Tax=Roseomonas rosulenta TaxID=2748667 RepID=UPI0018DFF153